VVVGGAERLTPGAAVQVVDHARGPRAGGDSAVRLRPPGADSAGRSGH
jgi:hypothetical protein